MAGDVDAVDRGKFAVRHLISKWLSEFGLTDCAVRWETDVAADAYHLPVLRDDHPVHSFSFPRDQLVQPLRPEVRRGIKERLEQLFDQTRRAVKARIAYGKKQAKAMVKKGLLTAEQVEDVLYLLGEGDVRTFGEIAIDLGHIYDDVMMQQLTGGESSERQL